MKLLIQIPCLNEGKNLGRTVAELPRVLEGVDTIEVLIVDDGSEDDTREVARAAGVHHIVRHRSRRGLAAAFMTGLDACLALHADVIVTTDADNQYRGPDIAALLDPILAGRSDLVIGDRNVAEHSEFSWPKRWLQRLGSASVRFFSGTTVRDSPSGFRAMTRAAALSFFVHSRFTYTLETVIQAGMLGIRVESVPIRTNPTTRRSRLFGSTFEYLRRGGLVILRALIMYQPIRLIGVVALGLFLFGLTLSLRFLYFFVRAPDVSGHTQSLVVGCTAVVVAVVLFAATLLAELLATNRRLLEDLRLRVLDMSLAQSSHAHLELERTGARSWSGIGVTKASEPTERGEP